MDPPRVNAFHGELVRLVLLIVLRETTPLVRIVVKRCAVGRYREARSLSAPKGGDKLAGHVASHRFTRNRSPFRRRAA